MTQKENGIGITYLSVIYKESNVHMKRLKSFKQLPHVSIHEQESEPEKKQNDETSYNQVPNKGLLYREIKVCTPDCAEYFVETGGSTFMLRVNTETNMCRLAVRLKGREFHLDDIYEAIPELPIMFGGEVNNELRDRLQKDGFVLPSTPYELGFTISDKDEISGDE